MLKLQWQIRSHRYLNTEIYEYSKSKEATFRVCFFLGEEKNQFLNDWRHYGMF